MWLMASYCYLGSRGILFPTECWGWSPYPMLRKNFLRLSQNEWFLFVCNYISVFLKSHFPVPFP